MAVKIRNHSPSVERFSPLSVDSVCGSKLQGSKTFLSGNVSCGAQNILRHKALNILTAAPNLARCFAHWARFASFARFLFVTKEMGYYNKIL